MYVYAQLQMRMTLLESEEEEWGKERDQARGVRRRRENRSHEMARKKLRRRPRKRSVSAACHAARQLPVGRSAGRRLAQDVCERGECNKKLAIVENNMCFSRCHRFPSSRTLNYARSEGHVASDGRSGKASFMHESFHPVPYYVYASG